MSLASGGTLDRVALDEALDAVREKGWAVVAGVLDPSEAAGVLERLWDAAAECERRGLPTYAEGLDPNASNVRVWNLIDLDPSSAARSWLVVEEKKYALAGTEVTIGRDPACDVWLDAPGVSRRHACIRTSANGDVTLEDNQSMNGTYVGRTKISGPTRLRDGDEIHLGALALTFRTAAPLKQTERVRPPDRGSE